MFMISWFTSRNGVCKLLCWKEIKVEFLSLLHDPFTLIFSVSSFVWFILPRSFILFPSGCQECHELINTLYDPSVLVTKEILSGAEKSHLHWLSLLWRKCYVLLLQGIQNLRRPQINKLIACVAGAKRGGGGGGEKLSPTPFEACYAPPPPLFPFLPIPYPFRRLLRTQATSSNFYHFTYTTQNCNLAQILSDWHLKISNYTSSQIAGRKSRAGKMICVKFKVEFEVAKWKWLII